MCAMAMCVPQFDTNEQRNTAEAGVIIMRGRELTWKKMR